jgi:hypothetical protein
MTILCLIDNLETFEVYEYIDASKVGKCFKAGFFLVLQI